MATTISQVFSEFKSRLELNESFQKKITTHHNAIRKWIENYDPKIETKLIGSLQRNTRIQPRSNDTFDIDILVILGEFYRIATDGRGVSPSDAIDKVYEIMREHGTYEKDFYYEVKRMREKYNWLVQTTPPTDEKSFEKARERIKKGIHKPNFKEKIENE